MIKKTLIALSFATLLATAAYGYFDGPPPPCFPKPDGTCPVGGR
jgi:hypothetical protein